jgi:hypothetical protein
MRVKSHRRQELRRLEQAAFALAQPQQTDSFMDLCFAPRLNHSL